MGTLIPESFLALREAVERIATAMFSGLPDQPNVTRLKELGVDVADGDARQEAVSKIWSAVDSGKLQAFVVGPGHSEPKCLTSAISKGIPLLRSPRGGDLRFFRPSKVGYAEFARWFGPDLSMVSVIFRETEIILLGQSILRSRRQKSLKRPAERRGRPSRQIEVESVVRDIVQKSKWVSTESLKKLTQLVNRHAQCLKNVSEDTVGRALRKIFIETGDRRFERVCQRRRAA
jgi:hypothetical protein